MRSFLKNDAGSLSIEDSLDDSRTQQINKLERHVEHTLLYLSCVRAPITLGHSVQSLTGPLTPPLLITYSFVTPQQTSSTWAQE